MPRPVPVEAPAGLSMPAAEATDAPVTADGTTLAPLAPADGTSSAANSSVTLNSNSGVESPEIDLWVGCRAAWAHQGLVVAQTNSEEASRVGSSNGERTAIAWVLTMNELRFGVGLVGAEQGAASATALVPRGPDLCCTLLAHRHLHAYAVAFLPGVIPARRRFMPIDSRRRHHDRTQTPDAEVAEWRSCVDLPLWVLPSCDSGYGSKSGSSSTQASVFVASSSDDEEPVSATTQLDATAVTNGDEAGVHEFVELFPSTSATPQTNASSTARLAALGGVLCPFELHGTCNDSDCKFQHLRAFTAALNTAADSAAGDSTADSHGNGATTVQAHCEDRAGALMPTSDDQEAFSSPFLVPAEWQVREGQSRCGAALSGVPLESDAVERWLPLLRNLDPPSASAPRATAVACNHETGSLGALPRSTLEFSVEAATGTATEKAVEDASDMDASSDDEDSDAGTGSSNSLKREARPSSTANRAKKLLRSEGTKPTAAVLKQNQDQMHGSDDESFMAFGDSSGLAEASANSEDECSTEGKEDADSHPKKSDDQPRYWVDKETHREEEVGDDINAMHHVGAGSEDSGDDNDDDMVELHGAGPIADAMRILGVHAATAPSFWIETLDAAATLPQDGLPRSLPRAINPKSARGTAVDTDSPIQHAVAALARSIEKYPPQPSGINSSTRSHTGVFTAQLLKFRLNALASDAREKDRIEMAFDALRSAPCSVSFSALAVSECYDASTFRLPEFSSSQLDSSGEHASTFHGLISLLVIAAKITQEALDTNRDSSYSSKYGASTLLVYLALAHALAAGGYPETAAAFLDVNISIQQVIGV